MKGKKSVKKFLWQSLCEKNLIKSFNKRADEDLQRKKMLQHWSNLNPCEFKFTVFCFVLESYYHDFKKKKKNLFIFREWVTGQPSDITEEYDVEHHELGHGNEISLLISIQAH